jgi:phage-related protein
VAPVVDTVASVVEGAGHAVGSGLTEVVTPITSQVEQTVNHVVSPVTNILHGLLG